MFNEKKRRTQITVETHEVTTIRMRHGLHRLLYCPVCRQNVSGLNLDQAAVIFQIETRLLGELFVSKAIHGVDADTICGNSLATYFS